MIVIQYAFPFLFTSKTPEMGQRFLAKNSRETWSRGLEKIKQDTYFVKYSVEGKKRLEEK